MVGDGGRDERAAPRDAESRRRYAALADHGSAHDLERQEDLVSSEALRLGMGIAGGVAGLGRAAAVRDRDRRERVAAAAATLAGRVRRVHRGAGRPAHRGVLDQGRETAVALGQRRLSVAGNGARRAPCVPAAGTCRCPSPFDC
ncbi:hypothetical protein F01_260144 [Burkholderia cenocepacia]|nr:hypothetical protein F01_260144 [Burkholderia cenocepacia]